MANQLDRIMQEAEQKRQPPKREKKMRDIVQQLQKTPIAQLACERAGVSRATYYRWRADDLIFSRAADRALEAGRFLVNDMAESKLIQLIKNGHFYSIRFWLTNNHPRYTKNQIHEYCHICETKSTEEKHDHARYMSRKSELTMEGWPRKDDPDFKDYLEKNANEIEDWVFERFEMLTEEKNKEEEATQQERLLPYSSALNETARRYPHQAPSKSSEC